MRCANLAPGEVIIDYYLFIIPLQTATVLLPNFKLRL
jgi:hypothetical protein